MDKNKYNHKEIEAKWQARWEADKLFSPDVKEAKNPFFNLMMFPYPSAEGLHVGNMYAFTGADVYGRFQRMQGKDVLEPIGLDGFGIHSENYALKVGRHPKEQAKIAEENFYRQLKSIGNSFDWQRTVETYDPNYYKWTQWIFVQLFKNGLAYRDTALVNWCPKDMTVLSDEQVIDGKCERCGTEVEKKELEQWFFRITKYAGRLLDNIEGLDWSKKVKIAQKNWIGRSEGAEIEFRIQNSEFRIPVFTTRPDTLYGATFMVVAPEHPFVASLLSSKFKVQSSNLEELKKYVDEVKNKTDIERTAEGKGKTGVVLKGIEAINPVNSKKIPILVSDYVLSSYGTGAVMAVPAHDQRDFETAKKFDFEIIPVIQKKGESLNQESMTEAYTGEGEIIGSGDWNGFHVPQDTSKVINWLEKKEVGKKKENFHLRDWLISRQRYWGPPIPMIYCKKCADEGRDWFTGSENSEQSDVQKTQSNQTFKKSDNSDFSDSSDMSGWYPVPEEDLPVLLPDVSDWKPMGTGKAPLANHPEFYKTKCPECGSDAVRETDVSDTFLDSSWYFLRYPSVTLSGPVVTPSPSDNPQSRQLLADARRGAPSASHPLNSTESFPWDPEITKRWLPVNQYIGGAEHSVLHLLYSRFVTMALHDLKFIDFEEPFSHFFAHGLIVKDGAKMSKSRGNVVVPDDYIAKYGADTLRCYLMFLGPYSDGGDFRDSGIEGMNRFINRVWRLVVNANEEFGEDPKKVSSIKYYVSKELDRAMNIAIKEVTKDISTFSYNTAIARLMEYYNYLFDTYTKYKILDTRYLKMLLLLLAPFAPFMTEELWQKMGSEPTRNALACEAGGVRGQGSVFKSIHFEPWPTYDEKYLTSDIVTIIIQVNGKKRGEMEVQSSEFRAQGPEKEEEQKEVEGKAREVVSKHLEGREIRKVIYVPGKIINFVI